MKVPKEVRDAGPAAVATYTRALPHGERWAVMCALQCPPGSKGTDRAYMEGRLNQQQFDDMPKKMASRILREARAAGISTTGRYYCAGIADKRSYCDPRAWVDSTADVLRVARDRNLTVEGAVNHQGTLRPPQRAVLSETIIKEEMRRYRRTSPGASEAELREKIIARHAHPAKRKGK